jgi:hypothetical protein
VRFTRPKHRRAFDFRTHPEVIRAIHVSRRPDRTGANIREALYRWVALPDAGRQDWLCFVGVQWVRLEQG